MKSRPFTKTEIKILFYNKIKRGMSPKNAREEIDREIKELKNNSKSSKEDKLLSKDISKKFNEEFKKLKGHGKEKDN